ncbi:hypothetical protein ACM66B_004981 [Microbotryomycetes sp. NB124-2]
MSGSITDNVGNWWAPQRNFLECSGGMSISEWCSAPREACCALCPMPPITGPATTVVWTASTFLNLIFTNMLSIESPYNFMFQFAASEGALIALVFRTFQKAGLSAFHFYYVPMYIVSTVPVGLGAAMTSPAAFSGSGGSGGVKHGHLKGSFKKYELDEDGRMRRGKEMKVPRHVRRRGGAAMPEGQEKLYKHESLLDDVVKARDPLPRPKLLLAIKGFLLVQLLLYVGIFSWVYFGASNFTQAHCNEKFGIERFKWSYFAMTFTFVLLGIVLWVLLCLSYRPRRRGQSIQMTVARMLHSQRAINWVWTNESRLKWIVSITFFLIWAALFTSHHFMALQKFLLLGDDPFDFGQVNWIASSFLILGVIVRTIFDVRDTSAAKFDALLQDARAQHEHARRYDEVHDKIQRRAVFQGLPQVGGLDVPRHLLSEDGLRRSRSSSSRSATQSRRHGGHSPVDGPSGSTTVQGQPSSQSLR